MGKASQSKKVARAARAAGPAKPSRRRWLWPAAVVAILVVGTGVIVMSRLESNPAPAQLIQDTTTTAVATPSGAATATTPGAATATTAAPGATATTAGSATATTAATSASTTATTAANKP